MTSAGIAVRWARTGLGASVTQPPLDTAAARPPLNLAIQLRRDGHEITRVTPAGLALLGPGDVMGLGAMQVLRAWPTPGAAGVNASDLVHVELADPLLPWMLSPFGPDAAGNLQPWMTLVVVPEERASFRQVRQTLVLTTAGEELPPWPQLHAWAHVHISDPAITATDAAAVTEAITRRGAATARLICPRRLTPRTTFHACLVPTFAAGAATVLTPDTPITTAAPAWTDTAEPVDLPVYWSARFTTGDTATFEDLAMALQPTDAGSGVGSTRRLAVDQAGPDLPATAPLPIGGALRLGPEGHATEPYDPTELRAARSSSDDLPAPTWGDWHIEPTMGQTPLWLEELNDWPPHRVLAGLGAEAVRTHQEELMAAAWEQAGQWSEADAHQRQAQAALAQAQRMWSRRLEPLTGAPGVTLQLTAPAAARLVVETDQPVTLRGRTRATCLPTAILEGPGRRLLRPSGALGRRLSHLQDRAFVREELIDMYASGAPTSAPTPGPSTLRTVPAGPVIAAEPYINAALQAWRMAGEASLTPCTPADLNTLATAAVAALRPERTLPRRIQERIRLNGTPAAIIPSPSPIPRLRVGPRIEVPLFDLLLELGTDWVLPGVSALPEDRILLTRPDPTVIEAFLVGANHEFARELLWRGYPADRGTSTFTRFWDRRAATAANSRDIPDINFWSGHLGDHLDPTANIAVLVARGRLFRDFPDLIPYAHEATRDRQGALRPVATSTSNWDTHTRQPTLQAHIPPDVAVFGFPLPIETLRGAVGHPGWYIVLAESPAGTRFGLASQPSDQPLTSWRDLSWNEMTLTGAHLDVSKPPTRTPAAGPGYVARSDALATILRRPPFRMFVHCSRLLPSP